MDDETLLLINEQADILRAKVSDFYASSSTRLRWPGTGTFQQTSLRSRTASIMPTFATAILLVSGKGGNSVATDEPQPVLFVQFG